MTQLDHNLGAIRPYLGDRYTLTDKAWRLFGVNVPERPETLREFWARTDNGTVWRDR